MIFKIGDDPYEGNTEYIPLVEDFYKHYHNTLALVARGPLEGKVVFFSDVVIENDMVPHYVLIPSYENGELRNLPGMGVTYSDLSPDAPFSSGFWWAYVEDCDPIIVNVSYTGATQWNKGASPKSICLHLGKAVTPFATLKELNVISMIALDNAYNGLNPSTLIGRYSNYASRAWLGLAARYNLDGPMSYPTKSQATRLLEEYTYDDVPRILGRYTCIRDDIIFSGLTNQAIGVLNEGVILYKKTAGKAHMDDTFEWPAYKKVDKYPNPYYVEQEHIPDYEDKGTGAKKVRVHTANAIDNLVQQIWEDTYANDATSSS